jgi:hypothetical protein
MTTSSTRGRLLASLAVLAIVAAALAVSVSTAGARTNVAAVAYRLTATLTPAQVVPAISAPTGASGHFHGILIRSGTNAAKVAKLAGCTVITAPRRSGLPTKINCGAGPVTLPGTAGQWRLVWRLSYSHLSGAATGAAIHIAPAGHSAAALTRICSPCLPTAHGSMVVTSDQAGQMTGNASYVDVSTAAHPDGEIRGQIVRTVVGYVIGR